MTIDRRSTMIRTNCFAALSVVFLASSCLAQTTKPSVAIPDEKAFDPVPAIAQDSIPHDQLLKMDQAELGQLFQSADAEGLLKAHELIESYFATTRIAERKTIVAALEETKLSPGIIGRLARLRLHWPALQPGVY